MIFAGPCLWCDNSDDEMIIHTAKALKHKIDYFRCKLYGGGTRIDKWYPGIGSAGIPILQDINKMIIPSGTEIQTPFQLEQCSDLSYIWIGARNSQNYGLLQEIKNYNGMVLIKRGFGQTINEFVDIIDLTQKISGKEIFPIERGIITIDREDSKKYALTINPMLKLKNERKDLFDKLIVDCSHSTFEKGYVGDVYKACMSIGVKNFMFECTIFGKSKTDQAHMLSVNELLKIIGAENYV